MPAFNSRTLAVRSFDFPPQRNPLVWARTFFLCFTEIVPLLTLGILMAALGRQRFNCFLAIFKFCHPFCLSCFALEAFALKWFFPGIRTSIFPFRVIFILFDIDLFVFAILLFFYQYEYAFRAAFRPFRNFIISWNKMQDSLKSFVDEFLIQIPGPAS